MAIPYNMLPMETLVAMSSAEAANAPGYLDAARMWTDVRTWIDSARTEVRAKSESLLPVWRDAAAAEFAAKVAAEDADLAGWAARIDASQVSATLTTLSSAITRTHMEVMALHGQYTAALSNPLTAWAAAGFQQAAGAVMSALGAQFDVAIAKTASAAGVKPPEVPSVEVKPSAEGNTPEDAVKALTATADAMSELQTLASGLGLGQGTSGGGGGGGYAGGMPALAGLDPATLPSSPALTSAAGAPGAGTAPTLSGMGLPYGTLGASGLPGPAKPLAAKRAPIAAADVAPTVRPSTAATAASGAMPPPVVPPVGGQAGAAVRPPGGGAPTGRSRTSRKETDGTGAVPADLRGRSAVAT